MAEIYVRSSDGDNADNGSTWALAKATLSGAGAIDANGDTIYLSDNHAESTASAITMGLAGSITSPVRIICVDDTGDPAPPTAVADTATITTTGNNNISFNTGSFYAYGLSLIAGSGAAGTALIITGSVGTKTLWEKCNFRLASTGSVSVIQPTSAGAASSFWKNCKVKFGATGQSIDTRNCELFEWFGGSVESGGSSPTNLFSPFTSPSRMRIEALDLSNLSSGFNFASSTGNETYFTARNCKLPASWSGSLNASTPGRGSRWSMYNCDSADTNYRLWIKAQAGEIFSETTIVRTGGASDGTTPLAWRMTTNSNALFPFLQLVSDEIVVWNEDTGSSKTVTVEIVHDSVGAGSGGALQDDEIYLEAMYLGTSGATLGTWISDAKADVMTAAANQEGSSETWTTTGLTTPVKQKLSVTFTPQEKGFIHARVVMAKASKTCYVDPKLTVT